MKNMIPLMQREWLQHRFAWAMLVLVPLALAVLPLSFGQLKLEADMTSRSSPEIAIILGMMSIVATTAVIFLVVWLTSLFITSTLARRDHGDRSIEFWLSLPTGHTESLAAPLLVHLVLVPAAALLLGLAGGCAISLLVVTRFVGIGEWFGLPWGSMLTGMFAMVARVMAGLPLATLWLSPLILLAVLCNALFKRWGLPVLAVGLGVGSSVLEYVFGQPLLGEVLARLGRSGGQALAGASGQGLVFDDKTDPVLAFQGLPAWAANDLLAALRDAASPAFAGALGVSALLFAWLVLWRQRSASIAS